MMHDRMEREARESVIFDDSSWPILRVNWGKQISDEAFKSHFLARSEYYLREHRTHEYYSIIIDLSVTDADGNVTTTPLPESQQKMQAEWQRDQADLIRSRVHGISFIINSKVIRFVLKTVNTFSPIPVKFNVEKTEERSIAWSIKNYKKQSARRQDNKAFKIRKNEDMQHRVDALKELALI